MRAILATALLLLWLAQPLAAHDFWIEPQSFEPAAESDLSVQLMVGLQGQGEPVKRRDDRIVRFALVSPPAPSAPGGATEPIEQPVTGKDGETPAGAVRITTPAPSMLVYRGTLAHLEQEAAEFEAYLREEGLDEIVALRAARDETDKPARERYSRCAKALLRPIGAAPGGAELFTRPAGLTLELVPERDPTAVSVDPAGTQRSLHPLGAVLLLEGKPLAGALVRATRLAVGEAASESSTELAPPSARTDENGRVELRLPSAGAWMLAVVHVAPAPEAAPGGAALDYDYESLWSTLTFEMPVAS